VSSGRVSSALLLAAQAAVLCEWGAAGDVARACARATSDERRTRTLLISIVYQSLLLVV